MSDSSVMFMLILVAAVYVWAAVARSGQIEKGETNGKNHNCADRRDCTDRRHE